MVKKLVILAFVFISGNVFGQHNISLIPQPVLLKIENDSFAFTNNTAIEIISVDKDLARVADMLSARLKIPTGYPVKVKKVNTFSPGNIHLQLNTNNQRRKEAYELFVGASHILISADSAAGIFYGSQTLIQLFPKETESKKEIKNISWIVPAVTIKDSPRFGWRGAMFDVTRHFFTKQQVKEFIDNMVKYKFNMLHLHLSDDQGWRIEIKSLPKLTEVGAWRAERTGKWMNTPKPAASEPKTYGGFYTHEDIKELIAYAKDRFVEILPEIDVPGHSLAAVASYPELTCTTDSTYQVNAGEKFMQWHDKGFSALLDNTLCPANEKVYTFLDKVFTEIAQLFPFPYIHMGGDECAKNFWDKNPQILALMKKEKLKDMHEVQAYFVKRVQKIVNSKGKKMMGWDEILEGGLSHDVAVMSWRGMKGGIKAAKDGHKVVMSPADYAYLDLYQGDPVAEPPTYSMVRLKQSYKFDPLPAGVDEKLILGGQGNLWTEQIQNTRAMQYMLYPRTFAVAEAVWSPNKKDWPEFVRRVENEFERLDVAEIKYSRSMYDPIFKASSDGDNIKLEMETELDDLDIHYSYDGSEPDNFYPKYTKPLIVPKDAEFVRVVTYRNGKQAGKQIYMPYAELQKRSKKK
jgi:hexosaminidase